MPRASEFTTEAKGSLVEHFFVRYNDDGSIKEKLKTHVVDKKAADVTFFPTTGSIERIVFENSTRLPESICHKKGYLKQGLSLLLSYRFGKADLRVKELHLDKGATPKIDKLPGGFCKVRLDLLEFLRFTDKIQGIRVQSQKEIGREADNFLAAQLPSNFKPPADQEASAKAKARMLIGALDSSAIQHLSPADIQTLVSFVGDTIQNRYKDATKKTELFNLARVRINEIPLKNIIERFKTHLTDGANEHVWSKFLRDNLLLIDPAYVHSYPELGLTLGTGPKRADFGLVDLQNFLDIFEIKRPDTKLINASPDDHENYYWHSDAVKAIVQAEKYLHYAERKAPTLAEDLKLIKGASISVIKPKVILIIGSTSQLDNEKKQNDFRILRHSLRNIEIVLYDELLQKIEMIAEGRVHTST